MTCAELPLVFGVLVFFFLCPVLAQAEDNDSGDAEGFMETQIEQLRLDEIQEYWEEVSSEYGGFCRKAKRGRFGSLFKGTSNFR